MCVSGRMIADVKRSVTITIGGQRFQLKTDAKPKYVKELASFVNDQLEEARASGKTVTTQSLALLAAMNIADELLQLRLSHAALKREVREKSKKILQQLEQVERC